MLYNYRTGLKMADPIVSDAFSHRLVRDLTKDYSPFLFATQSSITVKYIVSDDNICLNSQT